MGGCTGEKGGEKMTKEQKRVLHEMLYYQMINNTVCHPLWCYDMSRKRANWCLAALGEKLEEE